MSNDNMFDDYDWQPSENYGKFNDSALRDAKKTVSRFCLSLFLYLVISYAVIFAIDLVVSLILTAAKGPETAENFIMNPIYQMLISTLPMYVVAFPIFYIIIRRLPSHKRQKKSLSALELFYTFMVAEAFMMIGNLIGQSLNASISSILGIEVNNATADLIMETPVWLIFILVVIIAPIVEELIFRKLMIDKLSRFGDSFAIIISAVAFGLFHGNFYQFFYAAFLGLLLGYVYCRSGKVKYTVIFHMIINFLGSVAVLPIIKYEELLLSEVMPETGAALREFFIAIMAMGSYAVVQYAMVISGIFIFINAIRYRKIELDRNPEIRIPEGRSASAALGNVGSILFLVFSLIAFVGSIFLG